MLGQWLNFTINSFLISELITLRKNVSSHVFPGGYNAAGLMGKPCLVLFLHTNGGLPVGLGSILLFSRVVKAFGQGWNASLARSQLSMIFNVLKFMQLVFLVGITASIFTAASMLPQLIKLLREKKANDVSLGMLTVLMGGLGLWIWYGSIKADRIIVLSNAFSLTVNIALAIFTFRYKTKH